MARRYAALPLPKSRPQAAWNRLIWNDLLWIELIAGTSVGRFGNGPGSLPVFAAGRITLVTWKRSPLRY
jgi:hypothetical protein